MLTDSEVRARLEIMDLLARYSTAIDSRAWDDLDPLFTDDAVLDYTATGGVRAGLAEQKAYFAEQLVRFASTQHVMGLPALRIAGERATSRSICFNPLALPGERAWFVGLWYDDTLTCRDGTWRFTQRVQQLSYFQS